MTDVMLISSRGTLVFGQEPFLLHRLNPGAPVLRGAEPGPRNVEIVGYILPVGETEEVRASEMKKARRLICRIAGDPEGFVLRFGGREIGLRAETVPEFSSEAPLNGPDAAEFILRAVSRGEDSCFTGAVCTSHIRSQSGLLVFPLAVTEKTVFGTEAQSGIRTVENPGDMPAGFRITVTAGDGEITSFTVSRGGESITVRHTLAPGQILCIDTRPGHKDVTAGGQSVLGETDWRSRFFALEPGENTIRWNCTGTGHPLLTFSLVPRYLTGGSDGYPDI